MIEQTKAMELALEALGWTDEWRPQGLREDAITALREALAQELRSDEQPAQTDWEAVAADQAMTIALLKAEQPAQPQQEPVLFNGLTEAETNATASVMGLVEQKVLEHAPCLGMNCGITRTDQMHSAECQAEHAASIAGGKFVKPAQQEPVALGYMNAGHVHEMQQGRLPYGYVYPKGGAGANVAIYTSPPPLSLAQRLPDALVYDGYETPQYIEGWNDCREFMKGMK